MKAIEQLAVDSVLGKFNSTNDNKLEALEATKAEFKAVKAKLGESIKDLTDSLKGELIDIIDDLSPEAIDYIETKISSELGVAVKLK